MQSIDDNEGHGRSLPPLRRWTGRVVRPLWRRLQDAYVLFPIFSLLLLALGWSAVLHLLSVERTAATSGAAESSRELADTYEAQLVRNLAEIDQTLKTVKFGYELRGASALSTLRKNGMLPSSAIFNVAIADASGQLTLASEHDAHSAHGRQYLGSLANEPYFRAAREQARESTEPPSTLVSTEVIHNAATGTTHIAFIRSLYDVRGNFAGIVMVSVDPRYFTNSYDATRMGDAGLLMLVDSDGIVQAKRVNDHISWGEGVGMEELRRASERGTTASESASNAAVVQQWDDGVARYTNVRALHGFPLYAVVGLSQGEQLAQYRRHRTTYLFEAILGTIVVILLTVILSRTSWLLALSRTRARQARQTYYAASENSLDAFYFLESQYDNEGRISDFYLRETNRRGLELSGLTRDGLIGRSFDAAFPGFRYSGMFDALAHVAMTGGVEEHEWIHARADSTFVWLHRQVVPVEDGVVAIVRDISARKWAESSRVEQNRVLEMIATSTPLKDVMGHLMLLIEAQIGESVCVALLATDDVKEINLLAAPSAPESFRKVFPLVVDDTARNSPSVRAMMTRQPVVISDLSLDVRTQMLLLRVGMDDYHACWSYPIMSHDAAVLGTLTIFLRRPHLPDHDETQAIAMTTRIAGIAIERHQAEARIRHMATHDPLTGLSNRAQLSDRLDRMLTQARRDDCHVTVVFIDLDNFKLINDSLGHYAGDELLKTMARRMVACLGADDIVFRLGGDEFVLVLYDPPRMRDALDRVIERLRRVIWEPISLLGHPYKVSGSMGLATFPADGDSVDTLLMNADAAMYRAKELGRNNFQYFNAELNTRIFGKLKRQDQLRQALENEEFSLEFQPQVALDTATIFGVEALLRWRHPTEGNIAPATFLPIAEESGLIVAIDDWVLLTACRQNKAWQDAGLPPMTVSVNVSGRQFIRSDWRARVSHALNASGLAPEYLEIEVTEAAMMHNLEAAIATMQGLQDLGVKLAIDDFGAGYASLSALRNDPVVRLKLDRSFVQELPQSTRDQAIARAVIRLGRKLDLKVIAEGVETDEQLAFLKENDCQEIQGFHYSPPVSAEAIETLLTAPSMWSGRRAPPFESVK